MGNPWKGEPLRLLMTGTPIPIWMGTQNSPPLMLYNFDPSNNIYAGYQPNIAINGPNTQLLPPNFGLTMDGTRTIYVIGPKASGPLQVTPGGAHPFQLTSVVVVTNPSVNVTEDASTPAVVDAAAAFGPTATTAAFSPPAGSWLYALVNEAGDTSAVNLTVTDSGSHSWTELGGSNDLSDGIIVTIWRTFLASAPGSITVTAKNTDNAVQSRLELAVRVITNANANQSGAAFANNFGNLPNEVSGNIVTTKAGSLVLVCGADQQSSAPAAASPLSGTTGIDNFRDGSNFSLMCGKSTQTTSVPGSTKFGWSQPSAGNVVWCAAEIIP
jgi:hypothetical protein